MRQKQLSIVAVVLLCIFFIYNRYAFALGGGGFRNEAAVDAEATGKGQAFVAQADSPSAIHYNPAGLVQLEGSHVRVGSVLQAPRTWHTSTSGNETYMQMQTFLIPNFFYVTDIGLEKWRFGFSATSPYGLGTDWADDSFSSVQATESDTEFYQINPTVAYNLNDIISLGFGVDYMKSYVSKHKRITAALGGGDFHLKGDDDGWGYNVGLLVRPSERHSIGISYRSKIELTYGGLASLDNLNIIAIGGYNFPGSTYSTDVEAKLVLPRSLAAGYAFKPDDKWTIELDVEWTGWSSVEEDFVRYPNETDPSRLIILNDSNPSPKDWNDSLGYGLGVEYKATDWLELRGGYLFYQTPIPSVSFETALPDADRHAVTFGLGCKLREDLTLDIAYLGVLAVDRDVTNDVASAYTDLDGKYESYTNIFSVSFTYRY